VLTARGRDFRPVLVALLAWGNKHFAPEGPSVQLVNAKTGASVDPVLADPATGRPIQEPDYALVPGPAANERVRRKYASSNDSAAPAPARSTAGRGRPRNKSAR
jgi:hypothetical protein